MNRTSRLIVLLIVNFSILAASAIGWQQGVSHGIVLGTAIIVTPFANLFFWFLLRLRDDYSVGEHPGASPRKRFKLWVHLVMPVIGVLWGLADLGMWLADTSDRVLLKNGLYTTGMSVSWILIVLRRYKHPTESASVDEREQPQKQ